jgi:hypothetical protein
MFVTLVRYSLGMKNIEHERLTAVVHGFTKFSVNKQHDRSYKNTLFIIIKQNTAFRSVVTPMFLNLHTDSISWKSNILQSIQICKSLNCVPLLLFRIHKPAYLPHLQCSSQRVQRSDYIHTEFYKNL